MKRSEPAALAALAGWGRTAPTTATLTRPSDRADVVATMAQRARRGVIARGLGRSYGDQAQNAGGTVVSMLDLDRIDPVVVDGTIKVEGGVSLDALMRRVVPLGWFLPVTPGTRHVTVGGAIANDIHGKNHHRDGSFGAHVVELELLSPDGEVRILRPGPRADLFWATVGGMGLTGVILSATLRLLAVDTSLMRVDTDRARNLDDCMALMESGDADYRYSVAWIDCLASGGNLGRSVLTRGDHAAIAELGPEPQSDPLRFAPKTVASMPTWCPPGLLRRSTVRGFNEFWFRKAPHRERGAIHSIASFFHPLDGVRNWNRIYGPAGFVQYQVVVPVGQEPILRTMLGSIVARRCPSFLAVLKRFGPEGRGYLSFPLEGWTLALDIPTTVPELPALLDNLDRETVHAGGRVYLAKDARVAPWLLPAMYPRLEQWREIVRTVDPAAHMCSDAARRLHLLGSSSSQRAAER